MVAAANAFGQLPPMRSVTIEYENGMTITYEDAALQEWSGTYYEALAALVRLRSIAMAAQQAQAEQTPPAEEPARPANIRTLRSVLDGK